MTISNLEVLVANATRRALQRGETQVVPRVSDLDALMASTSGKIEIESMEEGREGHIVEQMLRQAVLEVFRSHFTTEELKGVVDGFEDGRVVHTGDDLSATDYASMLEDIPALRGLTESEDPRRNRQRNRTHTRGAASLQAVEQRGIGSPRHISRSRLNGSR